MKRFVPAIVLILIVLLTACSFPSATKPVATKIPWPTSDATASSAGATQRAANSTAQATEPASEAASTPKPTQSGIKPTEAIDPYAKITNFTDPVPTMEPVSPPATGNLKCGVKYTLTYPGQTAYGKGVWFWVGAKYGFAAKSSEMTKHGYFSDAYMNWVGVKGKFSPGFDGKAYIDKKPVTFKMYLPCQQ